jgi:AAA family ATP:ADP antiporter
MALRQQIADRTSAFYGGLFFWTNLLTLVLQIVVARLHRDGGRGFGLMLLPLIAFASYSLMALIPALGMVKVVKVAERAAAYSVQNTASHLLWLPTPARMKYGVKLLVDTVGVRLGDALAALTLLLGVSWLELSLRSVLVVNLVLVVLWLRLGAIVSEEQGRLAAAGLSH